MVPLPYCVSGRMTSKPKVDVFVGNLAYGTSDEQLHSIFSEVGQVVGVRIVLDRESNKPRGFAFVEYEDAATALSAIRNLDGRELNGRKLRVSYSNNSNLKEVAHQMGQKISDSYQSGGKSVEGVVSALPLHEAYDILANMKDMIENDQERARSLLKAYPSLVHAICEIQKLLGMRTPFDTQFFFPPPPPPFAPTLPAHPIALSTQLPTQAQPQSTAPFPLGVNVQPSLHMPFPLHFQPPPPPVPPPMHTQIYAPDANGHKRRREEDDQSQSQRQAEMFRHMGR